MAQVRVNKLFRRRSSQSDSSRTLFHPAGSFEPSLRSEHFGTCGERRVKCDSTPSNISPSHGETGTGQTMGETKDYAMLKGNGNVWKKSTQTKTQRWQRTCKAGRKREPPKGMRWSNREMGAPNVCFLQIHSVGPNPRVHSSRLYPLPPASSVTRGFLSLLKKIRTLLFSPCPPAGPLLSSFHC